MAVIKEDEGLSRFLRNVLDVRDKFFQFSFAVEVIISHRSRDIEPVRISAMETKISDLRSGPGEIGHQLREFGFIHNAKTNAVLRQEFKGSCLHPGLIPEFKD